MREATRGATRETESKNAWRASERNRDRGLDYSLSRVSCSMRCQATLLLQTERGNQRDTDRQRVRGREHKRERHSGREA